MGNGKELIANVDGRHPIIRRAREIYAGVISDLGGEDYVTTIQRESTRMFACIQTMCEVKVKQYTIDDPMFDAADFVFHVRTAQSIARNLGFRRVAKPVDMTAGAPIVQGLEDYVQEIERKERDKKAKKNMNKKGMGKREKAELDD